MKNNIIIYGVGKYGKWLYYFMKSIGVIIDCFCQTSCDGNQYYDDVKIIDIVQLSRMAGSMTVLIAIGDRHISDYIKGRLLNINRGDIYIYEFGDFIARNFSDLREEDSCYCNLCGKQVKEFGQFVFALSDVFVKHRVSGGGGVRDHVLCPLCGCTDRLRWQYWVLGKHTTIFQEKCSVLHIAPERGISARIQANELCDYYTGNIVHSDMNMHIVDVTDIQFRDNFFDYIIMNHVLEHVENEAKAISELKRVLKPDGKLILSFPICTDMDTYENPNARTPEARLREFGQEDHVRLYGRDYKKILERYGLNINVHSPQNECSKEEIIKYGFSYDDVSLICTY